MTAGLVSVIIPTYNRRDRIGTAVDSVLGQTWKDVEVLIVDDGSSDDTGAFVKERYSSEKRVRYLYKENGGVSSARNHGIEAARGEYIAFLDSDDWWKAWKLELQLAGLRHFPDAGMIWSEMSAVGPVGTVTNPLYLKTMYGAYRHFTMHELFERMVPALELCPDVAEAVSGTFFYGDISSQMIMGNLVHTSTVLLRRERADKVGLFREDLRPCGEDYEYHLRTCWQGPVAFIDVSTTYYQIGIEDQLTASPHKLKMALNFLKTIDPLIEQHRDRIELSDRMLNDLYRETHEWVGSMAFRAGDRRLARQHIRRALGRGGWSRRNILLAILLAFPGALEMWVRKVFHRPKPAL